MVKVGFGVCCTISEEQWAYMEKCKISWAHLSVHMTNLKEQWLVWITNFHKYNLFYILYYLIFVFYLFLVGIGITMEGTNQNYPIYNLLLDLGIIKYFRTYYSYIKNISK